MIRVAMAPGRLTVRGHAGYGPHGSDIVCAAVSALVYALVGDLQQRQLLRELTIRPGFVDLAAGGDCGREFALVAGGIRQLAERYPQCVALEE